MTKIAYIVVFLRTLVVKAICSILLRPFGSKIDPLDLALCRRILVIRPDEIGDFVLTTSFLAELRRFAPSAQITLVVKPEVEPIARLCADCDDVVIYDHRWSSTSFLARPVSIIRRALILALSDLRRKRFDAVFLPRRASDPCYAVYLAYFSGVRNRVGFSERATPDKAVFNHGFDMLLTHVALGAALEHAAEAPLELLRGIGLQPQVHVPHLTVSPEDIGRAKFLLADRLGANSKTLVAFGITPGNSVLKQWPTERFVQLGKLLSETFNCKILVLGASDEAEKAEIVANDIGSAAVSLAGKTDLRTLAAVLTQCSLYVGNDTGVTHIAGAVGSNVIALFGASCAHIYAPRGNVELVVRELECGVCRNGHKLDRCSVCIYPSPKCMEDIAVSDVLALCKAHLNAP